MIRGALASTAALLVTIGCAVAAILAGWGTGGDKAPCAVMRFWGRALIRIGRFPVRVEGAERIPAGGAILASNHQSLLDIPLLVSAFPRDVLFLAKRELRRIPLFGKAMERAGNLFVDREDPRDAVLLARRVGERVGKGALVVIFPEGTRSGDGSVGEFKEGAFTLARKTDAPLLPVFIDGGREAMPKGTLLFRKAPLRVRVLPPVPREGAAGREELARETRRRILAARDEPDVSPVGAR